MPVNELMGTLITENQAVAGQELLFFKRWKQKRESK